MICIKTDEIYQRDTPKRWVIQTIEVTKSYNADNFINESAVKSFWFILYLLIRLTTVSWHWQFATPTETLTWSLAYFITPTISVSPHDCFCLFSQMCPMQRISDWCLGQVSICNISNLKSASPHRGSSDLQEYLTTQLRFYRKKMVKSIHNFWHS